MSQTQREIVLPANGSRTTLTPPRSRPAPAGDLDFDAADRNGDGVVDREEWETYHSQRATTAQAGASPVVSCRWGDDAGFEASDGPKEDWIGTEEEAAAVAVMNALVQGDEVGAGRLIEDRASLFEEACSSIL